LKKSNFTDAIDTFIQLTTACQVAPVIIGSESCLYSQWFPGDLNEVSDACSRDFHLTDLELTNLILSSVPTQVPNGFKLYKLPQEIASWLMLLLQNQPQKMGASNQPKASSRLV